MLRAAIILFVLAVVSAVFGFGGLAASMAGAAKIAFYIFVVLAAIGLVMSLAKKA